MSAILLAVTNNELLNIELSTLSGYDRNGLDGSKFDVAVEDTDGNNRVLTVCCTDVAAQALSRIRELESQLKVNDTPVMNKAIEDAVNLVNDYKAVWPSPRVHGVLCGEDDSVMVSRKMFDKCVIELSGDYKEQPNKKTNWLMKAFSFKESK